MKSFEKATAMVALAGMLVGGIMLLLPGAVQAQYADMLYSPSQNQSSRSLRNPLIPTASSTSPYQQPYQGQPPAIGDGARPAPEIRGDLGAPQGVYSGIADPTHGNMFPIRGGQRELGPQGYVPDAGRRYTVYGQEQGMYDFGQGQQYGTPMGPGGKNGGNGLINNGGAAPDAEGMDSGGKSMGTGWVNNGGAAGDATGMGPGGKIAGGRGILNNGGAGGNALGLINNGGAAASAVGVNGGGKSMGTGIVNNGGAASGASGMGPGGKPVNGQGTSDRLFQHEQQPNRYDFQGPLPTVRTFSRYLVILGCVVATVFMAMACWAMVMGSPYGGSRVMGAAGGLLLLLAGYTIWKIVQMNTFHANSTGWESHYRDGTPMNIPGPGGTNPNGPFGGPQNPNNPAGPGPAPNNGGGGQNPNGGGQNPNGQNPQGGPIPNPPGSPFGPAGNPAGGP